MHPKGRRGSEEKGGMHGVMRSGSGPVPLAGRTGDRQLAGDGASAVCTVPVALVSCGDQDLSA